MRIVKIWDFNDGTPQGWTLGSGVTIDTVWTGTKGIKREGSFKSPEWVRFDLASITLDLSELKRPILIIPHYIYNETKVSFSIEITTPTKTVTRTIYYYAFSSERKAIAVVDIPRLVGDDSWRGSVTIVLRAGYLSSDYTYYRWHVDSIVLCDGADKTIYLPKPQTSESLESKTVPIDEGVEENLYLAVAVMFGAPNYSAPPTRNLTVVYDLAGSAGASVTLPNFGDYAAAVDTSDYVTRIGTVILETQAGTAEMIDKFAIALLAFNQEWLTKKFVEILLDVHEYPLEEYVRLEGTSPVDLWYTREYYHRLLASMWLTPYVEGSYGNLADLVGTHTIEFYDPVTGSLIDYLSVEFPSLATKGAYIPPDYYYETYGTHLIGSEHVALTAPEGSLISYFLHVAASVVGALASVDQIL